MDRKLKVALEACIQAIESGGSDLEGCLRRYPEQAQQLRPQLELLLRLDSSQKAERHPQAIVSGQDALFAELSAMTAGRKAMMFGLLTPALAKSVAIVAAGVLLVGAAGASASLGGPDPGGQVLNSVGIVDSDDNVCASPAATPGASPDATPYASPDATPEASPDATPGDDDCNDDDDDSGADDSDDDRDDDNSGPGSDSDEGDVNDHSSPGSNGDDDAVDDNSGPSGDSGDGDGDDNSGSTDDSDDGDVEDNSGPGS